MSVMFKNMDCTLLDHNYFISRLYKDLKVANDDRTKSLKLLSNLFSINKPKKKGYRIRQIEHFNHDTALVKQMYTEFQQNLPTNIRNSIFKLSTADSSTVRDLSKKLFQSTVFNHIWINGGNNLDQPLQCNIKEEIFLIPGNSRFLCGPVEEQCKKLVGNKYDVIIADPPWWNKYIRRLKAANDKLSYSMMYNEDIALIPVKELLSSNCIIAMWCTNAPSNIEAVKNVIFPKWGVHYLTTWYWLKVTTSMEPLCDFGTGSQKQPYERILLGKVGDVEDIPCNQLIVSVPSALHSHKPPLIELLTPYLDTENPQILELFARYLLPDTTSVGYEPLKWQHISLYENVT